MLTLHHFKNTKHEYDDTKYTQLIQLYNPRGVFIQRFNIVNSNLSCFLNFNHQFSSIRYPIITKPNAYVINRYHFNER